MHTLLAVLHLLSWRVQEDPRLAVRLMTWALGRPDLAAALVRVCERESGCRPTGVHTGDAHLSRQGWVGQVSLGHLDPACQPYEPGAWATHGAFGLSAASNWEHLPACYQPAILDLTLVSAYVALRRWESVCEDPRRRDGWCA